MKLLRFSVFLLFVAATAFAQQEVFTVHGGESRVGITLNTTHEVVHGTFQVQSGTIRFDRAFPQLSGSIVVAAGSGITGNGSRDKKMNHDILKADQFAFVSFVPKSYLGTIAATGASTIQVSGTFTLLGAAHELTVPMRIETDGKKLVATTKFVVPYVQWGLKNPSFLFWKADNDVTVDLSLRGELSR